MEMALVTPTDNFHRHLDQGRAALLLLPKLIAVVNYDMVNYDLMTYHQANVDIYRAASQ